MSNLTITIEEETLKRARLRALQQDTSVNQILREALEAYAGTDQGQTALARFIEAARGSRASSGPSGRSWIRVDLYD